MKRKALYIIAFFALILGILAVTSTTWLYGLPCTLLAAGFGSVTAAGWLAGESQNVEGDE